MTSESWMPAPTGTLGSQTFNEDGRPQAPENLPLRRATVYRISDGEPYTTTPVGAEEAIASGLYTATAP